MRRIIQAGGLVLALATAASAQPLPTVESAFGFSACADYKLATYEQIADYFRALDAATDRMQLFEIGATAEGRTQLMAIISSEANMRQLDRYRDISRRLARARGLDDESARTLARDGKAVVWIDFGLHSTEVAHAQTAPLMAYLAVSDESDEMRAIRDDVIFILVPNMNPDGTTLVSEWYMQQVGGPYERSSPPTLYQKYVGHDNNRDWFMFNMPESRNIGRVLYEQWFPQIVYNQHQAAPFPARIFVPPFADPMNPNIPPLVMRGVNSVGDAITRRLEQENKVGAISRVGFDTWWNGGMRTAPYFHNMVGILTETGHASATPADYDSANFPRTFSSGIPTLEPTTYYPSPYRGGPWTLRDSCDYMVTASMAVLDIGAKRREEWLYNIYQMGRDAIAAGASEAYVIPHDQWDPGTAAKMVDVLRLGGVEVHHAVAPFTVDERTYAAGTFVVQGAQPFRPYLTDLLNPQRYPDQRLYPGGPPQRPYDISGWTLPAQMGVEVVRVEAPIAASLELVVAAAGPVGSSPSAAQWGYAIDPRANDAFTLVNRLLAAGADVARSSSALTVGAETWPAGAFIVRVDASSRAIVERDAPTLGLHVRPVGQEASADARRLTQPRVAMYQAHGGNMDEGWTRWVLEEFDFPYTTIHDADIRAGDLGARFDAIILPDASYQSMLTGLEPGTMPEEYVGGMTARGVSNLYAFTAGGGTLVTLDTASELPLTTFGLSVGDVTADLSPTDFFIPGTLLAIDVDPTHPVAFGMPARATAFFARSPAFSIGRDASATERQLGESPAAPPHVRAVATYAPKDLLVSGWLLGERAIATRAAVVEAQVEQGRVVLLGFRAQHRAQPHGTFKLLFNAIYLAGSDD